MIGVLSGILATALIILLLQWNTHQGFRARLQQVTEKMLLSVKNTKQLQEENSRITELLNSTYRNVSALVAEYDQLMALRDDTLHNLTQLIEENTHLREVLNNTLQDTAQVQLETKELKTQLNSTLEIYHLMEQVNKKLHSILLSNQLSFIWNLCDQNTLQCSRCLPGWTEHTSRCFFLSLEDETWEDARRKCLGYKGDLAVVLNAQDQAFLTNMTFQFMKAHPSIDFHSAWIGLQDMVKEGLFFWVNGKTIQQNVSYWKKNEPNNAMASWDIEKMGQDCVAIVPPADVKSEGWLNSWDDIICAGKRHYLCETDVLILT